MSQDPASRRDNGLVAAAWGALVDVDPELSTDLLSRLAAAGVAAYVEPVVLPALDRLWVDPERADAARLVVRALYADLEPDVDGADLIRPVPDDPQLRSLAPPDLVPNDLAPTEQAPTEQAPTERAPTDQAAPDPALPPAVTPLDEDALFQEIVAGYSQTAPEPIRRWPAIEDLPDPQPPRRRKNDQSKIDQPDPPPPPAVEPIPDWLEPDALEPDEDDHYVPPPPPPLRWFQARTLLATAGIVLGILAIFIPWLIQLPDSNGSRVLGTVLMLSGVGALIWWMRDSFTGPDDGAVV